MAYPDFNPAQPPAIRNLNRKYSDIYKRQKKTSGKYVKKSFKMLKDSGAQLLEGFGEKTTIHGLNRIFQRDANKYERCFWLLTMGIALVGTIYVCLILSTRFQAGKLQSIVEDTGLGVYRIAFPATTICNINHLNWDRLPEAKEHFLPNSTNDEALNVFELVISLFDKIQFGQFDVFKALDGQPLHLVEHINFTSVFDFMTWRCDELFTRCAWRHRPFNCCDIFLKRRSKQGICWTFNTMETPEGRARKKKDPKYPWHTGSSGPKSAITARVLLHPDKHINPDESKGILVMLAEPSVWHRRPHIIPENTETFIDIEPTIYFYDNGTRTLTPEQRECFFSDERTGSQFKTLKGFVYMSENCESECHQEHLVKYCNCTMDLMFPPGQHNLCRVTDLLCLARNNDYFRFTHQPSEEEYVRNTYVGMVCKCYSNCYSLQYMSYVRPTFLPAEMRGNKSYVDLDIHFRSETMMVYCTNLVFSWIDLMVAFGGIAGLFLGCSLISAVEVFHFVFIELPTFVYKEWKQTKQIEKCKIIKVLTQIEQRQKIEREANQRLEIPNFKWINKNRIEVNENSFNVIKSNEFFKPKENKMYY